MSTDLDPKSPTRAQLATFLPNQELIRLFEQLFEKVPSNLNDIQQQVYEVAEAVGDALADNGKMLAAIVRLSGAIETLNFAPPAQPNIIDNDVSSPPLPIVEEGDVSPPTRPLLVLGDVIDVYDRGKAGNDLLIYNSTTKRWEANGAVDAQLTDNTTNLIASSSTLSNGAGASTGTLNNAPAATDPTKWVAIDDNGTTRYVPAW